MARHDPRNDGAHEQHHHHHGGIDYNVGRYAPKKNLGKIIVSVNNVEKVCVRKFIEIHSHLENIRMNRGK